MSARGSFHRLRVAEVDRITADAVAISFEVPPALASEFEFMPGQHVALHTEIDGEEVRRTYSICAPAGSGRLRIGVKRLAGGVFSTYAVERLAVGDVLEVMPPAGTFTREMTPGEAIHYGAVAAGSGITPILSILSTALATSEHTTATLIFVNVSAASVMFLEEVEDLKNRYLERLVIFHVLDGEKTETPLLSGRLDAERLGAILDGTERVDQWFLCGPLPMTDMVRETLVARGVDDGVIHRELFHVDAAPPRPPGAALVGGGGGVEVTMTLGGRSTQFVMPPRSPSILEAARAVRPEVPYSCTNGVCGTCRCRVVTGSVEMTQNFALEPDEVAQGFALACQAYPTSASVSVDFDG